MIEGGRIPAYMGHLLRARSTSQKRLQTFKEVGEPRSARHSNVRTQLLASHYLPLALLPLVGTYIALTSNGREEKIPKPG